MTRCGRPTREFCTDTFKLTIRDSRARDVYAIIDDVTTPYEPLYVIVSNRKVTKPLLVAETVIRLKWSTIESAA